MQERKISYRHSTIAYTYYGKGPQYIFCFHGFGEDGKSFRFLEDKLGNEYTLIAIDFPFHGETKWNEELLMAPDDLLNIINTAINEINPQGNNVFTFSIIGYSLGGRIALHLLDLIPTRITKIILIAPDGLRLNFWYWLGTQTKLGNKLFYTTMEKPSWFFSLIKIGNKTGLVNKSVSKFVHYYIEDKEVRMLLYKRWITMRKFRPNLKKIKKRVASNNIQLRFLFGSYDRIILRKRSDRFKDDAGNIKIEEIEAGHQLLKEKYLDIILALFSQ